MRHHVRIAPSILAADFANLRFEVDRITSAVEMLHVDVMDGHFVPNISLGPPVIASLRAATDLYLDCHLMITDPLSYLESLAASGANGVTVHIEAVPDPHPVMDESARLGLDVGLVINPPTPIESVEPYLDRCSMVVVMSVNPGFGGQAFIEAVMPKITRLREIIDSEALSTDIQIDGGINRRTAVLAGAAGADVIVAGTSVFHAADPLAAIDEIKRAANGEVT
ncbi:MAG: ribulose-phosphate 3-epimerase [Actinomycetota bacterium]|nr:ribulose-phosphate 3-epimerase [Actinomycetota bacterium]